MEGGTEVVCVGVKGETSRRRGGGGRDGGAWEGGNRGREGKEQDN